MTIPLKTMDEIFRSSKSAVYILRSGIQLENSIIHTVQFGSESTVDLGANLGTNC